MASTRASGYKLRAVVDAVADAGYCYKRHYVAWSMCVFLCVDHTSVDVLAAAESPDLPIFCRRRISAEKDMAAAEL